MIDIALDANQDIAVVDYDIAIISGEAQLAQYLRSRVRTVRGEWYLDVDVGLPYFEDIMLKAPTNRGHVESLFKQVILLTEEVDSLKSFKMDYIGATRELTVDFQVTSIYADVGVSTNVGQ